MTIKRILLAAIITMFVFWCVGRCEAWQTTEFSSVKSQKMYFDSGTLNVGSQVIYYAAWRQNAYVAVDVSSSFQMSTYSLYQLQKNNGSGYVAVILGNTQAGTFEIGGTSKLRLAGQNSYPATGWTYSQEKTITVPAYTGTSIVQTGKYGNSTATLGGMVMLASSGGKCLFQYNNGSGWKTFDTKAAPASNTSVTIDVASIQLLDPAYTGSDQVRIVTLDSTGAVAYTSPASTTTGFVNLIRDPSYDNDGRPSGLISKDTFGLILGTTSAIQAGGGNLSYGNYGTGEYEITAGATAPTVVSTVGTNTDALAAANQSIGLETVQVLQGKETNQLLADISDKIDDLGGTSTGGGLTSSESQHLTDIADDVHNLRAGDADAEAAKQITTSTVTEQEVLAYLNPDAYSEQMQSGSDDAPDVNELLTNVGSAKVQDIIGAPSGTFNKVLTFQTAALIGENVTIDLSMYDTQVAMFRQLCYWVLTICVWFASMAVIKSAFAGK